ncbi:hypothetical protein HNQ07_001245 [Deinococcus metalli]|uniref:Uncharacterized protein n=1 Tax=Deinococcus metalli TaxID=1141878 RepID=A0A7W8KES6_9DEIO|nr:hypothetical protein [Deinococcus metalli]MBB5375788.1 hypothetical protein [Deinococcus metalli]GHF37041.1 hypothetical protein GCM10017781_12150 [Deinococcus metalli]
MIYAFVNPDPLLTTPTDSAVTADLATGLSTLLAAADLIPVTGRDEEQVIEVPSAFTSWQILLHGAVVITPDGDQDPAWRRLIRQSQAAHADALTLAAQAIEHITMFSHLGLDVEVVSREGYPLLVRAAHPHALGLALDAAATEWKDWIDGGPFAADLRLLRDHGSLVVLPRDISADSAVNYVMGQLEDVTMTLGVGATDADRAFLSLCDLAVIPGALAWLDPAEAQDALDE